MQQREFNMYDSFYSQVGGIKKWVDLEIF
jgi:hypothetical protein